MDNDLEGAHVIMLGPGNEEAAKEALAVWKGGLQVGGGINDKNAKQWIDWGADKVIITSFLFPSGKFSQEHLDLVLAALGGDKEKLVIDLSCRRKGETCGEIGRVVQHPSHIRWRRKKPSRFGPCQDI